MCGDWIHSIYAYLYKFLCYSVRFSINTHAEHKMRVTSGKIHYILGPAVKFSCVIKKLHCDDGCHIPTSVIIPLSVTTSHSLNQYPRLWPFIWHLMGLKNQDNNLWKITGYAHIWFGLDSVLLEVLLSHPFSCLLFLDNHLLLLYAAICRCFVTP